MRACLCPLWGGLRWPLLLRLGRSRCLLVSVGAGARDFRASFFCCLRADSFPFLQLLLFSRPCRSWTAQFRRRRFLLFRSGGPGRRIASFLFAGVAVFRASVLPSFRGGVRSYTCFLVVGLATNSPMVLPVLFLTLGGAIGHFPAHSTPELPDVFLVAVVAVRCLYLLLVFLRVLGVYVRVPRVFACVPRLIIDIQVDT